MGLDTIYCVLHQQFHKNGFHRDEQSKVAVDSPWPVCSLHGMFFTLRRINDPANYLSSILFGDLFQRRSPLFSFVCAQVSEAPECCWMYLFLSLIWSHGRETIEKLEMVWFYSIYRWMMVNASILSKGNWCFHLFI